VILEGWKAQSLSAQNHSMAAGVIGRDFLKDYVLPELHPLRSARLTVKRGRK